MGFSSVYWDEVQEGDELPGHAREIREKEPRISF